MRTFLQAIPSALIFFGFSAALAGEVHYCPSELHETTSFNQHILCAVDELANHRNGGDWKNVWFTRNLDYGPQARAINQRPPGRVDHGTMCDAAVAETLIESLNILYKENPSSNFYAQFPSSAWGFNKETGLLVYIGEQTVADCSGQERFVISTGAAEALQRFGMGEVDKFDNLSPGDLIRFDRDTGPGHSTIFLGYIAKDRTVLSKYDATKNIVGFQYFSSQRSTGGLGVRSAYFSGETCGGPIAPATAADCAANGQQGVVKRTAGLVAGHMFHPNSWSIEKAKRQRLAWLTKNKVIGCVLSDLEASQLTEFALAAASGKQISSRELVPLAQSLTPSQKTTTIREFSARDYGREIVIPGLNVPPVQVQAPAIANLVAQSLSVELKTDFVGHRTQPLGD